MERNNMTREEAINKVRQMSLPKETMDILEALAPELTMSEDEMMIYELQGFLSSFGSDYFGTGEWQKFDNWLEKQKEQKPAEWSKNDAAFLNEITDFFESKTVILHHDLDMYVHWLKSLPERFVLQPKQEWSEEDKKMLARIIERGQSQIQMFETGLLPEQIDWLKSLRPKSHWKPSEWQMSMLLAVINEPNNAGAESCRLALKSLYEHLKKLM